MASLSGPPTAPAASFWVVVHVPGSEPEDAFEVSPLPHNVSALKDVVKVKMTPTLEHCASPQLRVWHCTSEPSQRPPNESPLKSSALLVRGAFYWVEAPAKPPAQGCWQTSLSLSLSLCVCVFKNAKLGEALYRRVQNGIQCRKGLRL